MKQQHLRQQPGQTFQQASTMHDVHDDILNADQDAATNAIKVSDEVDMIDALTGIPIAEDELMFAVTMIGPYNAMPNYKSQKPRLKANHLQLSITVITT